MDKDKKCHITFIVDGYLEIRELSCNELMHGKLGKLIGDMISNSQLCT